MYETNWYPINTRIAYMAVSYMIRLIHIRHGPVRFWYRLMKAISFYTQCSRYRSIFSWLIRSKIDRCLKLWVQPICDLIGGVIPRDLQIFTWAILNSMHVHLLWTWPSRGATELGWFVLCLNPGPTQIVYTLNPNLNPTSMEVEPTLPKSNPICQFHARMQFGLSFVTLDWVKREVWTPWCAPWCELHCRAQMKPY